MTKYQETITVEMVPIDQITVINPRVRNQRVFQQIVDSISKVGLKRPITVSRHKNGHDGSKYLLVCGQGRVEAFMSLGETEIPAIVVDVNEQESLVMSLVENIARRQHQPLELLHDIGQLAERGYTDTNIAGKIGLSIAYVQTIRQLLKSGEDRLLTALETGKIPLSIALVIATADDESVQEALAQAYQDGDLRGKKLLAAKRLIENRKRFGKALRTHPMTNGRKRLTSKTLVRAYEKEAERQRIMIKKAEIVRNWLLFIGEAMRELLTDENFVTLLRAESMETMPRCLADLVETGAGSSS